MVLHALYSLSRALEEFLDKTTPQPESSSVSLLGFDPPSEYLTNPKPQKPKFHGTPPEVHTPTAHTGKRATRRGCLPSAPAALGFLPLIATYFPPTLPALFRAGAPMGFPLQGFLLRGRSMSCLQDLASVPLRKPLPLFSSEVEKRARGVARLQSINLRSDRYSARDTRSHTKPMPSWGSAFLGFSPHSAGVA